MEDRLPVVLFKFAPAGMKGNFQVRFLGEGERLAQGIGQRGIGTRVVSTPFGFGFGGGG